MESGSKKEDRGGSSARRAAVRRSRVPGAEVAAAGAAAVDAYIAARPEKVRAKLQALREVVRANAPGAEELISYSMPAFRRGVNLVYFAAFARHIGFFPTTGPIEAFREELKPFKTSKGTVQFPLDEEIPLDLVARMVRFRVQEAASGASDRA